MSPTRVLVRIDDRLGLKEIKTIVIEIKAIEEKELIENKTIEEKKLKKLIELVESKIDSIGGVKRGSQ